MAGAVCPTRDTIRAALWAIGTAPGVDLVSSAFYMVLPDDTVLTFTDCAVVPEPTPEQLAADRARGRPRPDAPDRRLAAGRVPVVQHQGERARVRGSRTYGRRRRDFAELAPKLVATASSRPTRRSCPRWRTASRPGRPVDGRANVLVFPDLDAGNIAYKLVQRLGGASAIGPMLQGWPAPWPTCRAGPRPMILSRWPPWRRCSATRRSRERADGFSSDQRRGGVAVLQVEGQLVVGNRQELKDLVQAAVDARGSARADRLLAHRLHRFLRPRRARLHLQEDPRGGRRASPVRPQRGPSQSLFELTKLDTLFAIAETPKQALASF